MLVRAYLKPVYYSTIQLPLKAVPLAATSLWAYWFVLL